MTDDIIQLIRELKDDLTIFHSLRDEELHILAPYLDILPFPAGSTIFKEGDPGNFMGFVISGKLEVKKKTELKGREVVLAILSKGSFVGELSLIDGQPRSANVTAAKDSVLLILQKSSFDSFLESHPHMGIQILKGINRILSIRLRKSVDRLAELF